MNYCPLTIHCTSLCLDILQSHQMKDVTHQQIGEFYDEVYLLIKDRSAVNATIPFNHHFLQTVTNSVLAALHKCKNDPRAREASWLLNVIEKSISEVIRH